MRTVLAALALSLAACDAPAGAVDAGFETGPGVHVPVPPALPVLTPCPTGWTEAAGPAGLAVCEPFAGASYAGATCAFDEAHLPGTPGCARIGPPCAADGWPADLPTTGVVYVDGDAAPGGDGHSRATAFRTIGAALATAPTSGTTLAVAVGHYDEYVSLPPHVALVGACVDETRLARGVASTTLPALHLHDGASARDLSVDSPNSVGIGAFLAGRTTVTNVVVVGASRVGVWVTEGALSATNLVVRGTRVDGLPVGDALYAFQGAQVMLDGAVLETSEDLGLLATGAGTNVMGRRVVIHGPPSVAAGLGGGVTVGSGAVVSLSTSVIDAVPTSAVLAGDAESTLTLTDVVVQGTDGELAQSKDGAHVALTRTRLEGARALGLSVLRGGSMDLNDVIFGNVGAAPSGAFGAGFEMRSAHATFARVLVHDVRTAAIIVTESDAVLDASDLLVLDVATEQSTASGGVGVWAQHGAHVSLARTRIERVHEIGVVSLTEATVAATDLVVRGVSAATCPASVCTGSIGGDGASAMFGGALSLVSFSLENTDLCGVVVGQDGTLAPTSVDLSVGVVVGASVGACIQTTHFDTERLHDRVEFRDVGVPLSATSYALPMAL